MRRTYVGPFSRFAVDVHPQTGEAMVWDAETPDATGRATVVYTAASEAEALAWAREQADQMPQAVDEEA